MSDGQGRDLRSQQVLQDVLVLDGGRSVVLPVLLDLLVVLLPEERHLASLVPADVACMYVQHNVNYISVYVTNGRAL